MVHFAPSVIFSFSKLAFIHFYNFPQFSNWLRFFFENIGGWLFPFSRPWAIGREPVRCQTTFTFPAIRHHHPLDGTSYTAWWQRHVCKQLAQGCTWECSSCDLDLWPVDRKSSIITTRPPSHTLYQYRTKVFTKMFIWLMKFLLTYTLEQHLEIAEKPPTCRYGDWNVTGDQLKGSLSLKLIFAHVS